MQPTEKKASGSPRYPIPAERFRCEIEVQRSLFITTLQAVTSPEEARRFVAELKAEFPDANHNCWAYLVGPPGSSDQVGLSDDGEPHGTAGRPMLTALQHGDIGDTAVVVTRYFGGIKLGKGGMVKAYTASVQAALEQLPRAERVTWVELQASVDYAIKTLLERQMSALEVEILDIDYGQQIVYRLRLPKEQECAFCERFTDLTAGKGCLSKEPAPET